MLSYIHSLNYSAGIEKENGLIPRQIKGSRHVMIDEGFGFLNHQTLVQLKKGT